MYDFRRCKLCGEPAGVPKYKLKKMTLYVCAECDFHYIDALDDFPSEELEKKLLTDKHRSFIEDKLPQNTLQLKTDLKFVESHVDLEKMCCLDVGTGVGLFVSLLKEAGAEAWGIEPQQVFREFASEKYRLNIHPERVEEDYWQHDYADFFDVVTLWDTLEHVNFPVETIQAASNLVKSGGYLFLDTPSRESLFYRSSEWSYRISNGTRPLLLNTLYSPKPYCHKQMFTKTQLWTLLENAGFLVLGQSPLHRANKKLVIACQKNSG